MFQILIASNNPGKVREIEALLDDPGLVLVTPSMLGIDLVVEEDGQSYAENAERKALAFFKNSGLITLADDSGLEVEILGGAPGIYSARYSEKPQATDADRRAYLLAQLRQHPRPWKARFRCVIAITDQSGGLHFSEGVCPGEIIPEERGKGGFGYDPIFFLPEKGRTMAELSMAEKNLLSHRARAIIAAKPILYELLSQKG